MKIAFHKITAISVEKIKRHVMSDGSVFFATTMVIDNDGETQRIDLYAETAEQLAIARTTDLAAEEVVG